MAAFLPSTRAWALLPARQGWVVIWSMAAHPNTTTAAIGSSSCTGFFCLGQKFNRQEASITWCDLFQPKICQKRPKFITSHDVFESLKQVLSTSRDVIISGHIFAARSCRGFSHYVTDAGCPFKVAERKFLQIFRNFVPHSLSNFPPNFLRNFRGFFVLCFQGNGDHTKLTKNPCHFSMPNPQASTKKKSQNLSREQAKKRFSKVFPYMIVLEK